MRRRTQARSVTTESLRGAGGPGGAAGVRQFPARCEATHKGPEGQKGRTVPQGQQGGQLAACQRPQPCPGRAIPAAHVRAVTGAVRASCKSTYHDVRLSTKPNICHCPECPRHSPGAMSTLATGTFQNSEDWRQIGQSGHQDLTLRGPLQPPLHTLLWPVGKCKWGRSPADRGSTSAPCEGGGRGQVALLLS